ncbi:heat-inducible transcriptional repressor HrcA [Methyloceanibacter superfactus]|jgi:heat-inducible transcriptional repressor|uniref:Heat-inducible transcription repressor HrcA n=1 Tax=Methyloceanibacter superfactus TaxID=1774969 RepID=A0A1E3W8A4_9HYPH|nr:heat-inducible transcriptional repressor HrcA [Methyloceanibacter superfactus]ODS01960.1 heat-inducible transcriptional repressor HrcA [Methyloceanibacter superfactus]
MGHPDVKGILAAEAAAGLRQLNERSREIFKRVVETYLETGEPVGSRNLSRALPMTLSPASVRNVMSDLESLGLIYAPHTSAGRLPTQTGLRLFVDGLLEIGDITEAERHEIESRMVAGGRRRGVEDFLAEAGEMLSGLSRCAGVVLAEKQSKRLRQVEFVSLGQGKALAVLVGEDGDVENRIVSVPEGLPLSSLTEATNYINARIGGLTLAEARTRIEAEIEARRAQLDELTASVVTDGLATWSGDGDDRQSLIVCGRAHLLEDVKAMEDLERVRHLFEDLDAKKDLIQLLGLAERAEGVRIFIGSENKLFSLSGSALIVSPFEDSEQRIVGVLGVIGPTRLNYGRIIPMVDYTARLLGRLVP